MQIKAAPYSSGPADCRFSILILFLIITLDQIDAEHRRLDAFGKQCGRAPLTNWYNADNAFRCPRGMHSRNKHANMSEQKSRIAGGYFAREGEWPSYVQLHTWTDNGLEFVCGGTLINADMVMTANHCLPRSIKGVYVLAGFPDSNNTENFMQKRFADRACRMPGFNDNTQDGYVDNDVAVVRMFEPFEYNSHVQPACLQLDQGHRYNAECFVAGTGADDVHSGTNRLMTVPMKRRACPGRERTSSCYTYSNKEYPGNLCAGDSGGPLYCFNRCGGEIRQVVVGVASTSTGCKVWDQLVNGFADLYKLRNQLKDLISSCSKYSEVRFKYDDESEEETNGVRIDPDKLDHNKRQLLD